MKLITAIIRNNRLDLVRESLIEAGIERITVSRASGHGKQIKEEGYRGQKLVPGLIPNMRVEIAVNDEFVDVAISAIIDAARTGESTGGEIGDGKIFVTELKECIRIRTGERGSEAI